MSTPAGTARVSTIVTIAIVAGLFVAAISQRRLLVAWFTGQDLESARLRPEDPSAAPTSQSREDVDHYTCSMHPSVNQSGPGKCPICGMELVAVTKQQQRDGVVIIDEARRQLIGVRTEVLVEAPMETKLQAIGKVAYDESTFTDVNLKVSGWITKLLVNQTGQRVARGQTLFMLYSPELYAAQQDFQLTLRGARAGTEASTSGTANRVEHVVRAARRRLQLLGVSDAQIDTIAAAAEPLESIPITSPVSGFVIEKDVVEGASVAASMRLFRIAALDKVWVEADVYEDDLAHVHAGQAAEVTLDYLPGRTYAAKVSYVYPYLESGARTGRVRVEMLNEQLELRPGMYARVTLSSAIGRRVQVPASAVVYTGPRRLVFVDLGQGRFKPQEVRIGVEAGGMYEVLDGLKAGDSVATSATFLIAADARISTAAKYWESAPPPPQAAPETKPEAQPLPAADEQRAGEERPAPKRAPSRSPSSRSSAPAAPSAVYTCPMHPEVRSSAPGPCPKCGMQLVVAPDGTPR